MMKKTTDSIGDRNPLTVDEARQLANSIARVNLEEKLAGDLLLLFHAFTYERSMVVREGMLQDIKEEFAYIFPAFDAMMRQEIADRLDTLKGVA